MSMTNQTSPINRRTFVTSGCAGGALLLAGTTPGISETADSRPAASKDDPIQTQPVVAQQVMAVLTDIDRSGDPALIDAVFTRWGKQCFHSREGLKNFILQQRANFPGYVDYVNSNRAKYWERLDYDPVAGVIRVIGRKTGKCACAYAQCAQPAKALCTHCCKRFQTELFEAATGHAVAVQIDESLLLGGQRCCTTVRFLDHNSTTPASSSATQAK